VTVAETAGKTPLGPAWTEGRIVLRAGAAAPPRDLVLGAVMGHVSINFVVKTAHAGDPVLLSIRTGPYAAPP
jgi:hypothetical protein